MLKLKCIIGVAIVVLLLSVTAFAADQADKERAALKAAERWLALVDGGKYRESWREAAGYFRSAVGREQWEQSLAAVRRPLGRQVSRKVLEARHTRSLPGAPDGDYVVIQFATTFERKKSAVETVTPTLEPDGRWRVSGYYIR